MPGHADQFVAFDLETTGLTPGTDRIIEIGAVRFDSAGVISAIFDRLVNPRRPSGPMARLIHGISDEVLATAETAERVLPEFMAFLGDPATTTVLAHHSLSDAGFLGNELIRAGMGLPDRSVVDTLAWSRRVWPQYGNHRLDSLARRIGADDGMPHQAFADSLRVLHLFLALQGATTDEDRPPLAYPVHDGAGAKPVPWGWEDVGEVIDQAGVIQIEYAGGSRGPTPRRISPREFTYRGGVAYLVGFCHLDRKVKDFQVERVRNVQILAPER